MSNPDDTALDPLVPRDAKELYLKDRSSELTDESLQSHSYRLERFVEFCESNDISNMNEVTGRTIHRFKIDRKTEVKKVTLKGQLDTLRVFIRFCESIDAVRDGVAESVISPSVNRDENTSEAIIPADVAKVIIDYHRKYEYAKLPHVLFKFLWETGCRLGAAHSIDLDDLELENQYVELHHRPDEETTLKNGTRGERHVALSAGLCEVLADYIGTHRPDVTDEYGREPLFATVCGRAMKNTLRKSIYRITRPCTYGQDCPHGRDPDDCAGMDSQRPYSCPSSEATHAVRRGAITHYLSEDTPEAVISDRMNVSREVLDKHYDKRSENEKMHQRRDHLPGF